MSLKYQLEKDKKTIEAELLENNKISQARKVEIDFLKRELEKNPATNMKQSKEVTMVKGKLEGIETNK